MRIAIKFKTSLVALAAATTLSLAPSAHGEPADGAPAAAKAAAPVRAPGAGGPGKGMGPGGGRGPGGGGRPMGPPAWMRGLYGPWVVLSNKDALGLRPEQVEAIEKIMAETKTRRAAADAQAKEASDALAKITAAERIDANAALAKFDELSAAEQRSRRIGVQSMVETRKVLDAAQVEKLGKLAKRGPGGPRGPGGGGPGGPGGPWRGKPAAGAPAPVAAPAAPAAH